MVHPKMIWPCLNYRDAPAAIAFLTAAFGLVVESIHRTGDHVEHAELAFPEGGAIMLGSAASDGSFFERLSTGTSGVYVVTDDPEAGYERATSAGAHIVRELQDEPHGGRGFVVADLEGNLWSVGTYRGERR